MTPVTPQSGEVSASDVLHVDITGVHPMTPNGPSFPETWPVLSVHDGPIYEEYRSRPTERMPRVVHRRYRSGDRLAHAVWAHLGDDFLFQLTDSIWRVPHMLLVGNEADWCTVSLRITGDTVETINGRDHRLGAFSCYLVRYGEGMTFSLRSVSEQPLSEVCINFRPSYLADKLGISVDELLHQLLPGRDPWFSECRMTPEMLRAVRSLRGRPPTSPAYRLYVEAKSLELLVMYLSALLDQAETGRRRGAPDLPALLRVRRHVEENYDQTLALDDLAAMVGLGRKALTGEFKRAFGQTVQEYHQTVRMEVAKALLGESGASIEAVARRVGYGYPANFTKAFVKHTGLSPRDYRRGRILDPR